jgi:protein-S-isoprenylcysteine O-methyltransferase Ste14
MREVSFPEALLASVWVIIPLVGIVVGFLVKRLQSEERLRLIEKGLPLPPARVHDPRRSATGFRLAGIISVAVGLGLLVLFVSLATTLPASAEFPKGVIAVAAIPFLVGLGLLFEYRLRVRELKERGREEPRLR